MRNDQYVIPGPPVLVPLGVLIMVVSWVVLRRRGALTPARLLVTWLAGWYAVAVLGATLLPLHVSFGGDPQLYRINPIPFTQVRPRDSLLNVVMTLPFAAFLHVVLGVRDRMRVIRFGFLTSLAIELTQCVLILTVHDNRWAEANDLIANTLGVYLGFVAFRWLQRRPPLRRVVPERDVTQRRPARS
jgi:glycopeptide antibiotics resistance protein